MSRMEEALKELVLGHDLPADLAGACFEEIMDGSVDGALLGGFLIALRMKGETPEEIAAFAAAMRERSVGLPGARDEELLDTCGTGGDDLGGFNVSTLTALVAAGAGAKVAKHGNRASSGQCGSADLLAHLGVRIDADPGTVARCLDEAGIGFLFAPAMHPAVKGATPARRALGVRTVFNLLGPLSHPARAASQLMGVFDRRWVEPAARALAALGSRRALVVHGQDGMDEITTTAPTWVAELSNGQVRSYEIDARDFGIARADAAALRGGGPGENAAIARSILSGERGPRRDLVVANAAAALWVAGKGADLGEGKRLAEQSIDTGAAARKLDDLVRLTGEKER